MKLILVIAGHAKAAILHWKWSVLEAGSARALYSCAELGRCSELLCDVQLITNGGKSVHPSKVHYMVKDPLEKADWFQAGAHSIPETEDFLRMIGHFADSDEHLHAFEYAPDSFHHDSL